MVWEKVKLGDVCKIYAGGDKPQIVSTTKTDVYNIPIYSNGIDDEGLYGYTDKAQIQGNSITITGRGANVGTVFFRKTKFLPIIRLLSLVPNEQIINSKYLYYLIKRHKFLSSGSAQPQITIPMISEHEIYFETSFPIQTKIANILSAYDDLIENNQKQIKLLEEAAQRLYKEWFVDFRFPGYEATEFVDGLPKGWKKVNLSDIADIIMGQSPKSEFYNTNNQGLPFHQGVGSYGNRFVIDKVYSSSITRIAEANSILFSVRAPVGRLNITKHRIVIGRGLSAINHKEGLQSYLFYTLKERFFKDNIVGNGSIFASITKEDLLSQEFLHPTEKLAKNFNDIIKNIDKKIEKLDSKIKLLSEARDRLLPKLMSGEIEV